MEVERAASIDYIFNNNLPIPNKFFCEDNFFSIGTHMNLQYFSQFENEIGVFYHYNFISHLVS